MRKRSHKKGLLYPFHSIMTTQLRPSLVRRQKPHREGLPMPTLIRKLRPVASKELAEPILPLNLPGASDTRNKLVPRQKSRTPSKNKEPSGLRRPRRLEGRSKTKEKARWERPKVYEGNKDPEDHLSIFSAAAEQEESPMPVWCKMFCQTLGGAAQNWFDNLDPNNVDSFEEICKKFLENFSQQKRYAKDPTKIHDIKRRQNEGPSLEEKLSLAQRKWSVPLSGRKETSVLHGPEDPKNPETEVVQEKHEETWGYTLLIPEKIPSPHSSKLRRRSWPWKMPQHQRLLSVKKADRRSCGLGEVGPSSKGYPPKQQEERGSRKEQRKSHKHDKGRRKLQETF
ncbi:reverse transcriptase domain-containing protein [Tanacetum coccineum]